MAGVGSAGAAAVWMWAVVVAAGALAVTAVWAAWRSAIGRVPRWAARRDVPLTDSTAPAVRRYVVVSHTGGVVGAVLGLLLTFLPAFLYDIGGSSAPRPVGWLLRNLYGGVGWPYVIVTLWLGGVLAARFALATQAGGPVRARLKRRTVTDYSPPGGIALLLVLFVATLVAVAAGAIVVAVGAVHPQAAVNTYGAIHGGAAVAVVVGIGFLQRFIVDRTQRFTGAEQLAAEEAMRRASVRACTAAGVGLLGMLCADQLHYVGMALEAASWQDPPAAAIWLQGIAKAVGLAAIGATWAIFRGSGPRERPGPTPSAAAA